MGGGNTETKMEDRALDPDSYNNEEIIVRREKINHPRPNYTLKVESFSLLSDILKKTGTHKYESDIFEAGGYMWKLVLYPYGDTKRNGNDHISLYLAVADTTKFSKGCQVDVMFKFFVHDQIRDKYLIIQDCRAKSYHTLRKEHGFEQLLPLSIFKDSSNGYLVDDCCAFGVDVRVFAFSCAGENIKIINEPPHGTFTWKIDHFSTVLSEVLTSKVFTVAGHKWKLLLYPKGDATANRSSLSVFLALDVNNNANSRGNVYVEYTLVVKDQLNDGNKESTAKLWFNDSVKSWGFPELLSFTDLHNASKGYLVKDTLIVEVKIDVISTTEALS